MSNPKTSGVTPLISGVPSALVRGTVCKRMNVIARFLFVFAIVARPFLNAEEASKPQPFSPGDHTRTFTVDGILRTYLAHVPPGYVAGKPTPVVLALHGAAMNGLMMVGFTGLNATADKAGFIVVYPSGTGVGPFRTWNAGGFPGGSNKTDDVAFLGKVLDDVAALATVDTKRIFSCGMSNGGMMSYRLAAEMSDRIAAIAPVAGTIAIDESKPVRPVPVLHFHGTKDTLVPYEMPQRRNPQIMRIKSVEESIQTWVKLNGCQQTPVSDVLTKAGDKMPVTLTIYKGGKNGAEVGLITIEGGGHTWPGKNAPVGFIGASTLNISANDLMWEFFQRHPMK